MSNEKVATTLRLLETERKTLDTIQKKRGLNTTQKTIEFLINQYNVDQKLIEHLRLELRRTNDRNTLLETTIRDFQQGFKALNNFKTIL